VPNARRIANPKVVDVPISSTPRSRGSVIGNSSPTSARAARSATSTGAAAIAATSSSSNSENSSANPRNVTAPTYARESADGR
jgi:hypothetical protein